MRPGEHLMEPAEAALTCIICGEFLQPAFAKAAGMNWLPQPSRGTWFTSHGQYGSTVFDDFHGNYLLITICDKCMLEKAELGLILHRVPAPLMPRDEPETTVWAPGVEWCGDCDMPMPGEHPHDLTAGDIAVLEGDPA